MCQHTETHETGRWNLRIHTGHLQQQHRLQGNNPLEVVCVFVGLYELGYLTLDALQLWLAVTFH